MDLKEELTNVNAKEVSLCVKSNPPANRRTSFSIKKTKDGKTQYDVKKNFTEEQKKEIRKTIEDYPTLLDMYDKWKDQAVSNTLLNELIYALDEVIWNLKYSDDDKEDKVKYLKQAFDQFLAEYDSNPLFKSKENPKNPQDNNIKEKVEKMENEGNKNPFKEALDMCKSALSFKKEMAEVLKETDPKAEPKNEPVALDKSKVEADEEVEKASNLAEQLKKTQDALELLKKEKEAKEVELEKASYVAKAKDEYGMLAGTPEEIGDKLYAIQKSDLSKEHKNFILDNLKQVSKANDVDASEVGENSSNEQVVDKALIEEEALYKKAEELAIKKGITRNQALRELY